jgi:hypothetical protein
LTRADGAVVVAGMPAPEALAVGAGAGGLLALVCLWAALRNERRRRLVDDLPTITTASAYIGLVELTGSVHSDRPIRCHLANEDCVWHRWTVEERWRRTETETYRDSKGKTQTRTVTKSGWTTVDQGGADLEWFELVDDDGRLRVRPDGAVFEPAEVFSRQCTRSDPLYYAKGPRTSISDSTGTRRFHEEALPLGAAIYVVGHARERSDAIAIEIAADPTAELFLITVRGERAVASSYRLLHILFGLLAVVAATGGMVWATQADLTTAPEDAWPLWAMAAGTALAAWLAGWAWMAYNSLVGLRQRLRQAAANVDVQLAQRAALIPALVRVVEAAAGHERTVHTAVALARIQAQATRPGEPGPDPEALTHRLRALAESHPALGADAAFAELMRGLTACEDRIALARGFYNSMAAFLANRRESVPDGWIARLAGIVPPPPLPG